MAMVAAIEVAAIEAAASMPALSTLTAVSVLASDKLPPTMTDRANPAVIKAVLKNYAS